MIRCLFLLALTAAAHQFHYSATEINWNSKAATVEVVASLHADDIEALLRIKTGRIIELDRDRDAEKLVCDYMARSFELRGAKLRCLGIKVGRDMVDVFLEGKASRPPRYLRNEILLADIPDQKNHVTLKQDDKPAGKSLDFAGRDTWKPLNW